MTQNLAKSFITKTGILLVLSAILLNAVELHDACEMNSGNYQIKNHYTKNHKYRYFYILSQ